MTLAIFCKVVDNYGDIGICWRLARQLQREHGVDVTLWVDDLESFHRIWPQVSAGAGTQCVAGVTVRHWQGDTGLFAPMDVADIVIEFFAVDIPDAYVRAMAQRATRPVWLNLEGLSAEEWVDGCHRMPSTHPRLPLTKHFFFPGFSGRTGGLLRESGLEQQRLAFQDDPKAIATFLASLGVTPQEMTQQKVSLFCYAGAPVAAVFSAWEHGPDPLTCIVPEGVASAAVAGFLCGRAVAGAVATRGMLTVRVIPFVPQQDYDKLLWACDMNFVRGEDSFVRAQWAARPFIWHIYPQNENLHHVKLRAFLDCYAPDNSALRSFSLRWNGTFDNADQEMERWPDLWSRWQEASPSMRRHCDEWEQRMQTHGDLASNLLAFAASLRI